MSSDLYNKVVDEYKKHVSKRHEKNKAMLEECRAKIKENANDGFVLCKFPKFSCAGADINNIASILRAEGFACDCGHDDYSPWITIRWND